MRGATLPLLLIVAACDHGPTRAELQDRVAQLEDENDTLKQQLGEAQDHLEERRAKPGHAGPKARRTPLGTAASTDSTRPAHAARLEREIQGAAYPRSPQPPKPAKPAAREAQNAASEALIAAADARKAMAQR